jgi:gliding motility-associated-like protein
MKKFLLVISLWVLIPFVSFSQATYNMQTLTVSDCEGFLEDSNLGLIKGNYDHNEDYIFTICVKGAANIYLTFSSFCTEKDHDSLEIFEGSDTLGKKLGGWHGTTSPGQVVASGECMTIRFRSDLSVPCTGWRAFWEAVITKVAFPNMASIPNPTCETDSLDITLDQRLDCDTLKNSKFTLLGPNAPTISSVTPRNCDTSNTSDKFTVKFSRGLNRSGDYTLIMDSYVADACDSNWVFQDTAYFQVTDCPIEVDLFTSKDTICLGTCADLTATITGGDSANYTYTWTGGLSGAPPKTVCPTTTTTYILTVSDGVSPVGKDTVSVAVFSPPVLGNDTTVCYYNPPMYLQFSPPGGTWSGEGITNAKTGLFDPNKVSKTGTHTLYYSLGGGCMDSMKITVYRVWGAAANGACPGSNRFRLWSWGPRDGTGVWSGPKVTTDGWFTPDTAGIYTVTYTWKGCSINKKVYVEPASIPVHYDTMCLSEPTKDYGFSPYNGIWSGTGIINWYRGRFDPQRAGIGDHLIRYRFNGCEDTLYIHVADIDAKTNEVTCPNEDPFTVIPASPSGGYWTGTGITDSLTGMYDPSFATGNYNDTITYHLGNCTDWKVIYIRNTVVQVDTLKFCIEDTVTQLRWQSVQNGPWGGTWSGPGVVGNSFVPTLAGYGNHTLVYTANSCSDSVVFVIYPNSNIQADTSLCIGNNPYVLRNPTGKGNFYGTGITNNSLGIFDPQIAGIGTHRIMYYSEFNCVDSLEMTVTPLPTVNFSGLSSSYCFKDTIITLTGSPAGGVFTGAGIVGNTFNPSIAGTGAHRIRYTYGDTLCRSSRSRWTDVGDTLRLNAFADFDSICPGDNAQLSATGSGGMQFDHHFSWSSGQDGVSDIFVNPPVSTSYTVTLTDGCSDPVSQQLNIHVHPAPSGNITTSTIQCFGETGWAKIRMTDNDPYTYTWNSVPPHFGDSIVASVTSRFRVTAVNQLTGCDFETNVTIPGYNLIKAAFNIVPQSVCLSNLRPDLFVIDQSVGGITGYWDFGDGTQEPYSNTVNPIHSYPGDTSSYRLKLYIENEGGCSDSAYIDICMDDSIVIYAPSAFTPGVKDQLNPVFQIKGAGLTEFELLIMNRWGEILFHSTDINEGWDGTFKGKDCKIDMYAYRVRYKGKSTKRKEFYGTIYLLR